MFDRKYAVPLEPGNVSSWALQANYFTTDECDRIIAQGQALGLIDGVIGGTNSVADDIRRSRVAFFDPKNLETRWIFDKISAFAVAVNQQFWQFDLNLVECLQFTEYSRPGDFYTAHVDMRYQELEIRKLSISVQLSDPKQYQGSDLRLFNHGSNFYPVPRDRGTVIVFPSYTVHEVTPVTSGTRYSLVSWIAGPPFR